MVARMAPAILFGLIAGAIVDRVNRKTVMITADVARGGLYALLPFLGPLWGIFLVSFVIECFSLLWTSARDAAPELRAAPAARERELARPHRDVRDATARRPRVRVPFGRVGPVPVAFINPAFLALWLDAGTFATSALLVSRSRSAPTLHVLAFELSHIGRDIADGVRFLRENSLASAMTLGIGGVQRGGRGARARHDLRHRHARRGEPGMGHPRDVVRDRCTGIDGDLEQVGDFVERENVFVWSIMAAAGTLAVLAAMPEIGYAAVITVILGVFCGSAWVSGMSCCRRT